MGSIGWWEILIVLLLFLLLFGAKRLPEIGRSLGKGMREFKKSLSGVTDELEKEEEEKPEEPEKPTGQG